MFIIQLKKSLLPPPARLRATRLPGTRRLHLCVVRCRVSVIIAALVFPSRRLARALRENAVADAEEEKPPIEVQRKEKEKERQKVTEI